MPEDYKIYYCRHCNKFFLDKYKSSKCTGCARFLNIDNVYIVRYISIKKDPAFIGGCLDYVRQNKKLFLNTAMYFFSKSEKEKKDIYLSYKRKWENGFKEE